jgi:hypothetical protein
VGSAGRYRAGFFGCDVSPDQGRDPAEQGLTQTRGHVVGHSGGGRGRLPVGALNTYMDRQNMGTA